MQFVAMSLDTLGPARRRRAPGASRCSATSTPAWRPPASIQRTLQLTVAEGVAAGAVDLGQVDGLIAQLDAAAAGVRGCSLPR